MCVCGHACVRACVRVCVRVRVWKDVHYYFLDLCNQDVFCSNSCNSISFELCAMVVASCITECNVAFSISCSALSHYHDTATFLKICNDITVL